MIGSSVQRGGAQRPTGSALVTVIGPHLAGPLAVAINDLLRRARVNGSRLPVADLEALRDLLTAARSGQESPDLVPGGWGPEPAADPVLLTTKQVAIELNLSERTVRRLISDGDLPARRPTARTVRVHVDDVQDFARKPSNSPTHLRAGATQ